MKRPPESITEPRGHDMHSTKNKLLSLLAALALGPLLPAAGTLADDHSAAGADIVFSAGRKDGGYWGVAERMRSVAAEQGLRVQVLPSVGSIENLNRLADPESPVNLTLTQADALKHYLNDNPGFANRIQALESIGLECVFVIASPGSGIETDQDLQDPAGRRLAIPGADSGVAVTFAYMTSLVPGLDNTRPVYTDTLEAMKHFGRPDAVDAVMLVHRPKVRSPELQLALDDPLSYRLIPVEDRHLADTLPSGEEVYEFLDLPLVRTGLAAADRTHPTICTKGLLLSSPRKLGPGVGDRLRRLIDTDWMRVYRTES
jgi:hypothetical protein